MDLRRLRYFIAVAEEGHITRAAERLNIQQPPLSRLIKEIEQEVDVQLFFRKPRGVELTEAGRAFLDKARIALANVDQAIMTARRTGRGEQGQISVGMAPTSAFHPFVPSIVRAFRETFPLVSLTLEESSSDLLVQALHNDQIDVAFIRSRPREARGLQIDRLMDEDIIAAVPSGHALAPRSGEREAALPIRALADEPFLRLRQRSQLGLDSATIAACHAVGFTPKFAQEVPRSTSTFGYVAAGVGIAFIPASMQRMQMHGVSYRRLSGPVQPRLALILASRRGDPSAVLKKFLGLVRRSARDYGKDELRR